MLPHLDAFLGNRFTSMAARALLTFPFWSSGLQKLSNWSATVAEMAHFGLVPHEAYAAAVIFVQLVGSAAILVGPFAWVGAWVLIVFTALTIPIAHAFWTMSGQAGLLEMYTAMEHIGLIGGLLVAALLRHHETRPAVSAA
jgi:transmembrane protein